MRAEVLLQVKVSNHNVSGGCEEVTECIVEDDLATVFGMFETLFGDVLVNEFGHLRAGDEFFSGKTEECAQLRRHILLAVEAVVGSTSLSFFTIGVFLNVLDLANKLGQVLNIGAEGGKFEFDVFKRHYIFLTCLIFKCLKK
jgi:hypothetical protein